MNCALLRCQNPADNVGAVTDATGSRREIPFCAEHRDRLMSGTWVLDTEFVDIHDSLRPAAVLADPADLNAGGYRTLTKITEAFQPAMVNGAVAEVLTLSLSFLNDEADRDVRLVLDPRRAEILATVLVAFAERIGQEAS